MANNYSNPNYINPNYPSNDNVNQQDVSTNETNTQQAQVNIDEIIKSYVEKDKEKTDNLTKQREIINQQYDVKKKLEEELAQLRKQNEDLQSRLNSDGYADKLESLEQTVKSLQEDKIKARFAPIQNLFEEFGIVGNEDFKNTISIINERYNLDLIKNPNVELARFALSQIYQPQDVNAIPNGGYVNSNYQDALVEQKEEEAYQAKLNERLQMIKQKYNK